MSTLKVIFCLTALIYTGVLVQVLRQRRRDKEHIYNLNKKLSKRVQEFNSLNKELESFSYSVSHDLRAPLRGIIGFSQVLLDDFPHLPGEAVDLLHRIAASSKRMGELIDGLLSLSRFSRREIVRESVDLLDLAHSIFNELKSREPERAINFKYPEKLLVKGDPVLFRVLLENLIGNAFKFTRVVNPAQIILGISETEKGIAYFIKDNGAGFDMKYADKLFGAFQRLHSLKDFEGIGVGLATVQRIVHRHGGEIWAHSELQNGATFYFTLQEGA